MSCPSTTPSASTSSLPCPCLLTRNLSLPSSSKSLLHIHSDAVPCQAKSSFSTTTCCLPCHPPPYTPCLLTPKSKHIGSFVSYSTLGLKRFPRPIFYIPNPTLYVLLSPTATLLPSPKPTFNILLSPKHTFHILLSPRTTFCILLSLKQTFHILLSPRTTFYIQFSPKHILYTALSQSYNLYPNHPKNLHFIYYILKETQIQRKPA